MSYQSKFTGEEIDSLLSNINNISNNFLSKTLFSGEGLENTTVSLTDSVENYDFLLVEAWIIAPKEEDTLAAVTSKFISLEQHKHNGIKGIYGTIGVPLSLEFNRDNKNGTWGSLRALIKNAEVSIGSFITGNSTNYQGVLKKVTGINFIQSSLNASNPIGSILPIMGTEAPQDYLICDGSELNIAEYKELANYFEKQFGSKNHFGGDGISTFAVPDLRNEFLRGYHNNGEKQLSGEIGIHQDATEHKIIVSGDNGVKHINIKYETNATGDKVQNYDSTCPATATMYSHNFHADSSGATEATWSRYTSRPTNVAVLFCIKYTENNTVSVKEKDYFHAYIEDNDGISASTNILINPSAGWIFDYNRGFEYDDAGNVLLKANKTYEVSFNIERAKFSGNTGTLDLVLAIEDTQFIVTSLNNLENGSWGQSGGGTRIITPKQDCYFTVKSTQWTGQTAFYIANISIREI